MSETKNETYEPVTFDAIKIGLASPDKICLLYTSDAADD
mgnify:CR=1 FL=1